MHYIRNRACSCMRCRAHSVMGAAILITFGVLFLLQNYLYIPFHRTFPILLMVIGCVLLLSRSGSTEGHINPPVYVPAPPAAATPQQWNPEVPAAPTNPTQPNDPQVKP
jgi:magnesium-transporting ATPase (P-type)